MNSTKFLTTIATITLGGAKVTTTYLSKALFDFPQLTLRGAAFTWAFVVFFEIR